MPRLLPLPPTVAAEVRNVEYAEIAGEVVIPAGQTTGYVELRLPATDVNLKSIRVYPAGYTGYYSIDVEDGTGKVVYRYTDMAGTLVDQVDLIVRSEGQTAVVRISIPAAQTTETRFTVALGLSYIA
jgi:hypothetical protein